MTTRHDASFSDLDRARALARRLRPEGLLTSVRPAPEAPSASDYVRFSMPQPPPEAPTLQERLTRCLEVTAARAILVLGADGRPVGLAGEWTSWPRIRLDAASARLVVALDQAERIEGRWDGPRSIGIAVGADWIAGLRLGSAAGRLTVGLLVDRPLGHEAVAELRRELDPDRPAGST